MNWPPTEQDILDWIGVVIVVLTGIVSTGAVAGKLGDTAIFWFGVALLAAKALEERYKRRVKIEALYTTPPPRRGPLIAPEDMAAPPETHHPAPRLSPHIGPPPVPEPLQPHRGAPPNPEPLPGDTWPAWRKDEV